MADVLGYLQQKGLNPKRASASEVHLSCPFCDEPEDRRGRCYVNVDPDAEISGLWHCKLCDARGSLVSLKRHFGDPVDEVEEQSHEQYEIYRVAAAYYHEQLGENAEAFAWLRGPERNLKFETIVEQQLGYANGGLYQFLRSQDFDTKDILLTGLVVEQNNRIVDSLNGMVTIPYLINGNCVSIRGRAFPFHKGDKKPKYKTCGGNSARLFNTDAMWSGDDEIVVCEGELDAIVMTQLGFPAVGVPGANAWQQHWDNYLIDMKRVWLVYDNDKAGDDGAKKMVEKFGPKIKRIHLEHEGRPCDVSEWVALGHTAEDFTRIKAEAGTAGLLVTVDQARLEHSELQGLIGVRFNNEELDHWIQPGLLPSQVMVVLAKSGCMAGSTEIAVNRAGKGFAMSIAEMHKRWSDWDESFLTFVQRADGEHVRLGEVAAVVESGVKPTYTVTTNTGRTVRATAEHPFLTVEGWLPLGELQVGAEVSVNQVNHVGLETVTSIELFGEEMTYDISMVDEPHNFLANGFVVHNSGKTVWLLNQMQQITMVPGQEHFKFLFVSLEQTRGEWFERARRIHRFYNLEASDKDCLDYWRERLMIVDKNRITEKELSSCLDDYEYRMGGPPDVVFVDYLGYWAQSFRGERYERTSDAIMTLKAIAKDRMLPIITPHQVSRVAKYGEEPDADAARDAGVVEETADFLFILWSPDTMNGADPKEKSGLVNLKVGKCITGDALITKRSGERVAIATLANCANDQLPEVLSMTSRGQLKWAKPRAFVQRPSEQVYRLTLRTGRQITTTGDHQFFDGEKWVRVLDLQEGTNIATPRFLDAWGNEEVDEQWLILMALLIADGSCHEARGVAYYKDDPELQNLFIASLPGDEWRLLLKKETGSKVRGVRALGDVAKQLVRMLEKDNLRVTSYGKHIPDAIFTAPKSQVQQFLGLLWSGDGTIGRTIASYSSVSRELAEGVAHLLIRLGIQSRLHDRVTKSQNGRSCTSWCVTVRRHDNDLFVKYVGSYIVGRKRVKADQLSVPMSGHAPSLDVVPMNFWRFVTARSTDIKARAGISTGARGRSRLTSEVFQRYVNLFGGEGRAWANSEIFWDEVVSVVPRGNEPTFCLDMGDEQANFVANDIVVHNSRHGGRGIKIGYQFAPISLTMVPLHNTTDAKLLNRARSELMYEQDFKDKWPQAVYRHRTGFQGKLDDNPGFQEGLL